MSEPEVVLESASVTVWYQPGPPDPAEIWINFNGLRDVHITFRGFIRHRLAPGFHIISKQDHWYRGRDMPDVIRFINDRTAGSAARVIVLGNSMGGFGALIHSAALRCDLVIVAGAQVLVDDDISVGHDDRYRPEWNALETPEWQPFHDASKLCTRDVPIELIYDPHAQQDSWHAQFLRPLANVRRWRAPFTGHETLLEMRRAGLWIEGLQAVLASDEAAWMALMPPLRDHRHQRFPYHLAMGMRYYRRGRLVQAERHFRRMTEIQPSWIESHQFLARALRDRRMLPEAIEALEGAIPNLDGDHRYWWIFQGIANLHLEAGDIAGAAEALMRGHTLFPMRAEFDAEHAKLRLNTARNSADLSAAARHAARAASRMPDDPYQARLVRQIYTRRTRFIAMRGRARTVVAALERIAASEPGDVDTLHDLSRAYESEGRIDDAMAVLEPVRPPDFSDPERNWIIHRLAGLHFRRGEPDVGMAMLRSLAEASPSVDVLNDLTKICEELGDSAAALAYASEAVARFAGARDAAWLNHMAEIQLRAGAPDAAQGTLAAAAEHFPNAPDTFFALARFKLDRPVPSAPAASRLLLRAIAVAPERAPYRDLLKQSYIARARRLAARGRDDLAARLMRDALAVGSNDIALHIEAGRILAAGGDTAGAIAALRTAADGLSPPSEGWAVLHRLTALHAVNGDLAAAEAALVEATERFPGVAETHFELGKFRVERPHPNPAAAARSLRRALRLRPGEASYEALLDRADHMRADRLIDGGRPAAAARILRGFVEAAPQDMARHVELIDALAAAGMIDEAVAALRPAAALVREDRNGWWPYHRMAALLARGGDLAAAETVLAEAAERFPDRPEAVAEFGKFKFEKPYPEFVAAARLLRRAIALAPEDDRLHLLLRRCREMARRAGRSTGFFDSLRWRLQRRPGIAGRHR